MNNERNQDQLPPHSKEAEAALLGCVLLDAAMVMPAIQKLVGIDNPFYVVAHRTVWEACVAMEREARPIELITLLQRVRDSGNVEYAGGDGGVSALLEATPSAAGYESYLAIVWEKFLARSVLANQAKIAALVRAQGRVDETTFGTIDRLHQELQAKATRGTITPQHLKDASYFREEYTGRWFGENAGEPGDALPFEFPWKIRRQEMTVFTGDNGSGKSSMLCWMALHLAQAGWKVCIASMEVPAEVTMWMMASQLLGHKRMVDVPENRAKAAAALEWMKPRIGFYAFLGITQWQHLLDTFRYAAQNAEYDFFIVDSVMRIGIPDDDYAQQGVAAAQFAQFAQTMNTHVVLVIHENKSDGAGKGRIRGSKQWSDSANNLCRIERNEDKGQKVDDLHGKLSGGHLERGKHDEELAKLVHKHDAHFVLMKQRWPGSRQNAARYLWFDPNCFQFRTRFEDPPLRLAQVWDIWNDAQSEVDV